MTIDQARRIAADDAEVTLTHDNPQGAERDKLEALAVDRILIVGKSIRYTPPRVVAAPLAPIEPGSPRAGCPPRQPAARLLPRLVPLPLPGRRPRPRHRAHLA